MTPEGKRIHRKIMDHILLKASARSYMTWIVAWTSFILINAHLFLHWWGWR